MTFEKEDGVSKVVILEFGEVVLLFSLRGRRCGMRIEKRTGRGGG